ncbi:MAG: hypothetical protein ABR987_07860 [Terracidiphilus sp.]|jgi:hypothetical protein
MDLNELQNAVLILAGLPGCGKTTLIDSLKAKGWSTFDDYKAGALDNCSAFHKSQHFQSLIANLKCGHNCAISDIDFCHAGARAEAIRVLQDEIPGLRVDWVFFSRDERACEANVRVRNRDSLQSDLKALRHYAKVYIIPNGVQERPAVSGSNEPVPPSPDAS